MTLTSELDALYGSNANPILRLKESQRGVRILSKRKRGMLLGARFVENVPLWYKFKPTSPRDADTANTMLLVIYSAAAVCEPSGFVPSDCGKKIGLPARSRPFLLAQEEGFEPPCLLGKRFSRRLTNSDFRGKYQTLTEDKRG